MLNAHSAEVDFCIVSGDNYYANRETDTAPAAPAAAAPAPPAPLPAEAPGAEAPEAPAPEAPAQPPVEKQVQLVVELAETAGSLWIWNQRIVAGVALRDSITFRHCANRTRDTFVQFFVWDLSGTTKGAPRPTARVVHLVRQAFGRGIGRGRERPPPSAGAPPGVSTR